MPVAFGELSAEKIRALPVDQSVVFYPVGPLEDHGPHLPVDLDAREAEHICQSLARHLETELPRWIGIVMPPMNIGVDTNTNVLAMPVRAHVLRDALVDGCRDLGKYGFRRFVCVSGHWGPRQLTAIEEASKLISNRLNSRFQLVSASSALVPLSEVLRSPLWPDATEHGGARDTSVALYLKAPVDPKYKNLPNIARPSSRMTRLLQRMRKKVSGYWGSPAEATAERGKMEIQRQIGVLWPRLKSLYDLNEKPRSKFRTWYSILPPNWGFFKAWILIIGFFTFMSLWIWLSYPA